MILKLTLAPGNRLSDGTFKYWRDGHRIRWARIHWADDGSGGSNHGAAQDLLWAIEHAWGSRIET